MNVTASLDAAVAARDLLTHPFYLAWSAGTLPVSALAAYAREYGAFIDLLPQGWDTLGLPAYAAEERGHAALWRRFGAALGTAPGAPLTPGGQRLAATATALFADVPTALGALYAFEAQQPGTARSKLAGLRTHYQLPADVAAYFAVHADDVREAAWLRAAIEALGDDAQRPCAAACEALCAAMWDALSELHAGCAATA